MVYKNCALFKKSLSAVALSLAFQSPFALAMENPNQETNEKDGLISAISYFDVLKKDEFCEILGHLDFNIAIKQFSPSSKNIRNLVLSNINSFPPRYRKFSDDTLTLFHNLTELSLPKDSQVTNMGVSNLTNLTALYLIHENKITDEGINMLSKLSLLHMGHKNAITNLGINQLTNLMSLSVGQNTGITNESLHKLTNLTELSLSGNNTITDIGISQLTKLNSLHLVGNNTITDAGISNLTNLTHLGKNNIITDRGMSKLTKLSPKKTISFNFGRTKATINLQEKK